MPQEKYICSASSEIRILYPEKYTKLPPSQTTGPFHFTQRRPFYILFSSSFTFWLNPKVFTRVWEGFVLFFPEQRLNPRRRLYPPLRAKLLFSIFLLLVKIFFWSAIFQGSDIYWEIIEECSNIPRLDGDLNSTMRKETLQKLFLQNPQREVHFRN